MSEQSMVERVARAIFHGTPRNRPWEVLPIEFRRQYEKRARAAIEEMREPTDAMVKAGWDDIDWGENGGDGPSDVFAVMIDAALKED